MENRVVSVLACIILLVSTVLVFLYQDSVNKSMTQQSNSEKFQKALGGMGMGATTVPAWNFSDFDPRLQPGGYDRSYPIPGGYSYSPDRLTMISSFKE